MAEPRTREPTREEIDKEGARGRRLRRDDDESQLLRFPVGEILRPRPVVRAP